MAIFDKVNFLHMGRYGKFSEQTYRNNFENETFDRFAFNEYLIRKALTGKLRQEGTMDMMLLVWSCW